MFFLARSSELTTPTPHLHTFPFGP